MTSTSRDISAKTELLPLAAVVTAIRKVADPAGVDLFLVGAAARDLILTHMHGIETSRATKDVDFAVMVKDWATFSALRTAMLAGGDFTAPHGPATHRLKDRQGLPLDIVPFGGIERPDRTIAWPPDQSEVFDCFGMREALSTCSLVQLPNNIELQVPSIPALALLKITAWQDRKHGFPGRDAPDFILYASRYLDCDDMDRVSNEHADLFDDPEFDYPVASARLLARDIGALLDASAIERIIGILAPEAQPDGVLLMARQSGMNVDAARKMIAGVVEELKIRSNRVLRN